MAEHTDSRIQHKRTNAILSADCELHVFPPVLADFGSAGCRVKVRHSQHRRFAIGKLYAALMAERQSVRDGVAQERR